MEDMKNLLPVELKERIDYLSGQEIGHNGIHYVQDVGEKVAGKLYMCKTMKKIFRCKENNSLVYIDESKYESMSLETLLDKLQNLIKTNIDLTEEALVMGKFALLYTRKRVNNTSGNIGFAWQNFSSKYKRVITSWCTVFKNAGVNTQFSANLYWDHSGNFQLSCSSETDHSIEVFAIVEIR